MDRTRLLYRVALALLASGAVLSLAALAHHDSEQTWWFLLAAILTFVVWIALEVVASVHLAQVFPSQDVRVMREALPRWQRGLYGDSRVIYGFALSTAPRWKTALSYALLVYCLALFALVGFGPRADIAPPLFALLMGLSWNWAIVLSFAQTRDQPAAAAGAL